MYDIIIIGGGPGGYVAAIRGAQLGAKVALIEQDKLGGVCLNRGCIPTKTLLHSAELYASIKNAAQFGIKVGNPEVDFPGMIARKNQIVKTLSGGVEYLLKTNGVEVVYGSADLLSTHEVTVDGITLNCRNIIIAVGSAPVILKVPGAESPGVITSDQVMELEQKPDSMAIIGGGVIGIEMAALFANLGCVTTIIEMMDRIAPMMDPDISKAIAYLLTQQGVKIITQAKVESIRPGTVTYNAAGTQELSAVKVLMAVGRRSNGLRLALDHIGIKHDRSVIATDLQLRTNIPNIFAIGDVNGKYMLAHVASAEGIVAVENIMGRERTMDYHTVPQCIYTFPEVASVGMTEEQAVQAGYRFKVSRFPLKANGKSLAVGNLQGFIKMLADSSGQIIGAQIIAPHATDLIAQCSQAIKLKVTAGQLAEIVFPHPTFAEIIGETAHGLVDYPIHS